MYFLISVISFFWVIRTCKFVLFWIYLWQLKEYHVGRFLDHFRTYKGKRLFFNPLFFIKIVLLPLIFISDFFIYILLIIYIIEALFFIVSGIKRTFKKPVFTFKTVLLVSVSCIITVLFLFKAYNAKNNSSFTFNILLFDIFTPLIISFVVLFFQPLFVLARNNILKKAQKKISQCKNITVIGITGSYGKTSTKEFLTAILSSKFNVLSTKEHQNSEIGIAQTILNDLTDKHRIFIVEMGSYNKGGISLLCDMVKPKIGMVTGVNQQHLATFGSLENLLSAEGGRELVMRLPQDGLIILNGDNKYCLDLYKKIDTLRRSLGQVKKKIYTLKKDTVDSDIWTEDLEVDKESISFITMSREKQMAHFNVNVLGRQNVQNMLGAILAARELGMSFEEILSACKNIRQEQAGITLKKGIHNINIIDASYSSNPDGVMADLDYLNVWPQKKIIIMPCLIELGPTSQEIHYQIGKKIAEVCDLAIITTKDKFKEIKEGALQNGMPEDKILLCDKSDEILTHITTFCKEGDAVLLEGRVPSEVIKLLK